MTRDELIIKIADLFIDNSDSDGSWEPYDITEAVMSLIASEGNQGQQLLGQCGHCSTWYPYRSWDSCPYWDSHPCDGGCGETNENCTCDCCEYCGCYECECPRCRKCGEVRADCGCPEEEAVFA